MPASQLAQWALWSHLLVADSTPPRPAEQVPRRDEAVLPRKHVAALQSCDVTSLAVGLQQKKHGCVDVKRGSAGEAYPEQKLNGKHVRCTEVEQHICCCHASVDSAC